MKSRICIAGKNDMAVDLLCYLLENLKYDPDDIIVVCNKNDDGHNNFMRSLKFFASKYGVREATLDEVYSIENLLFISLEFDRLVKPEKFNTKRLFNIHFSLLPRYKGMYTSAMPILNGEKESGVTLHRIDRGIDTGEVIAQETFPISGMTCRELYFAYTSHGSKLIKKNILNLIDGMEQSVAQDVENSSYYSKKTIDYSNLAIDLNQTAEGIARQIRAYSFREYQLPTINGKSVIDFEIHKGMRSWEKPGTILCDSESGVLISTIDYNISIFYDRLSELKKACADNDINKVKEICVVKKHINELDEHGWSPLMIAVYNGNEDIAKWLIIHGANIFEKNHNGTNVLMYAKEGYKKTRRNDLCIFLKKMGLSEYEQDYYDRDLVYYMEKEEIRIEEIF